MSQINIPCSPYTEKDGERGLWVRSSPQSVLQENVRDECIALKAFVREVETAVSENPHLWDSIRL